MACLGSLLDGKVQNMRPANSPLLLVMICVAACVQGPPGPEGPGGPPGSGAQPTLTWVDANGRALTEGASPVYVDAAGRIWTVDMNSGRVGPTVPIYKFFIQMDCGGEEWVPTFYPPRQVLLLGDGGAGVRGDHQLPAAITQRSYATVTVAADGGYQTTCLNTAAPPGYWTQVVGPLAPVPDWPTASYTPPLHQELR